MRAPYISKPRYFGPSQSLGLLFFLDIDAQSGDSLVAVALGEQ
jgi:hypothetical protein